MADLTDLEITKRCAEAMGDLPAMIEHNGEMRFGYKGCMGPAYDPLHDDAQAMALLRLLKSVTKQSRDGEWAAIYDFPEREGPFNGKPIFAKHANLNRAICLCVAQLHSAVKLAELAGKG